MKSLLTYLFMVLTLALYGQKENKHIREGNELYNKGKIKEAEKKYQEALTKNKASDPALFNLGDTWYKQGKYEESTKQFKSLAENKKSGVDRSRSFHNLGNSYLKQNKFEESIKAYKEALKLNPSDEDTRYNLAYAQAKLNQQKQDQQKKDDQKKDQKKEEDKKDKKDEQKKDDQNKDDQKKEEQDKQKQQQQQPQMSEEDAKRMLEAINQQDKATQDRLKKEKGKAVKVKIEKDW